MERLLHRLNILGGVAVAVALFVVALLVVPDVSLWLQVGTACAGAGLFVSLRQLRDEEQGDRALVQALLSVAILGAVVLVTLHSVHSWRWLVGIGGLLVIPLLVGGFSRLVDGIGNRQGPSADEWRNRPRY